ncbi:MAG: ornithine cyclodeaminase family protein [Chloroflexota bacterium]|nr:ornithine cyclodeaminase family protein [Chloroflexota bacterium]
MVHAGRPPLTLLLTNEDVLRVLDPRACIDALEIAFRDLAAGEAVNRPRSHTYTPLGDGHWYLFKSMDGSVPRLGVHAIRLSSDHTYEHTVDGKRRRDKIPLAPGARFVGLVLLFDIHTLEPLAILQDGELQRMRVGCTSALAAKHLARPDARRVALIGSGWQAETQLVALASVRELDAVRVFSRRPEAAAAFAERVSRRIGRPIEVAPTAREAVDGADIVACATNSNDPVIDGSWLAAGQHVGSVQSHELDMPTIERADVIVVRSADPATFHHPPGNAPVEAAEVKHLAPRLASKTVELGDVVRGRAGRRGPSDVTLFTGGGLGASSGLGIQFAAVADTIYRAARERHLGREIPTDQLTETAKP